MKNMFIMWWAWDKEEIWMPARNMMKNIVVFFHSLPSLTFTIFLQLWNSCMFCFLIYCYPDIRYTDASCFESIIKKKKNLYSNCYMYILPYFIENCLWLTLGHGEVNCTISVSRYSNIRTELHVLNRLFSPKWHFSSCILMRSQPFAIRVSKAIIVNKAQLL